MFQDAVTRGGIILARTMALLVNPVHWRDKCGYWASGHARLLALSLARSLAWKVVDGGREKHSGKKEEQPGKKEEQPPRACQRASERPRYDDDEWDCELMSLTRRTYLLLEVLMSHYAPMDIKHPRPQTNQQEIHFMVKREENAKWIGV